MENVRLTDIVESMLDIEVDGRYQIVEVDATPPVVGMVNTVSHLVEVKEIG